MFEFTNNHKPKELEHWKTGAFHFCVQYPNLEALVEKIVANGGRQRMPITEYYPGEKPQRMVYMEDPFGVIFEIYSHSHELTYSPGAYPPRVKIVVASIEPRPPRGGVAGIIRLDEDA